jgi:hypothetical protein
MQFGIGKLLILLTNIIAENEHEAWQAVFNPHNRKIYLELNALMHDEFVLDSRKPLIDDFGRLIERDGLNPFRYAAGKPLDVPEGRHIIRERMNTNKSSNSCWRTVHSRTTFLPG